MAVKKTESQKVRKKKWFHVVAPPLFKERIIGEVPLYESKSLLNKKLKVNMMNLTGNPKSQHISVILRINQVKEAKGQTEFLGFEMISSSLKRFVRKGRSKIDDSIVIITSDNKKIRIKPLIITRGPVNKPVKSTIRLMAREDIANLARKLTFEKLTEEIISFKLQNHIGNNATKITPIRDVEIRSYQLIEKEGVKPTQITKAKARRLEHGQNKKIIIEEQETTPEKESLTENISEEESYEESEAEEEAEKTITEQDKKE